MKLYTQDLNRPSSFPSSGSGDTSTFTNFNFNFSTIFTGNFTINDLVAMINAFLLAWSFFYTFFCLIQFFNLRILAGSGEIATESAGMEGMYMSQRIWLRYLFTLPFFAIFAFTVAYYQLLSLLPLILYILVAGVKILTDLNDFIDIINDGFDWSKNLAKFIKSITKIKLGK